MAKGSLYSAYRSAGASVGKYQKGLYAQQGFEAQKTSSAIMSKKKLEKIQSTTAAAAEAVGMISDWREEKIAKREHKEMMSMFGTGDSSGGAETSGGDAGTIEKAGKEPTFWEEVKQKMTDDEGLFQGGKEGKLFGRASDWFFETGDQQSLYQQAGLSNGNNETPPVVKKDVTPPVVEKDEHPSDAPVPPPAPDPSVKKDTEKGEKGVPKITGADPEYVPPKPGVSSTPPPPKEEDLSTKTGIQAAINREYEIHGEYTERVTELLAMMKKLKDAPPSSKGDNDLDDMDWDMDDDEWFSEIESD